MKNIQFIKNLYLDILENILIIASNNSLNELINYYGKKFFYENIIHKLNNINLDKIKIEESKIKNINPLYDLYIKALIKCYLILLDCDINETKINKIINNNNLLFIKLFYQNYFKYLNVKNSIINSILEIININKITIKFIEFPITKSEYKKYRIKQILSEIKK